MIKNDDRLELYGWPIFGKALTDSMSGSGPFSSSPLPASGKRTIGNGVELLYYQGLVDYLNPGLVDSIRSDPSGFSTENLYMFLEDVPYRKVWGDPAMASLFYRQRQCVATRNNHELEFYHTMMRAEYWYAIGVDPFRFKLLTSRRCVHRPARWRDSIRTRIPCRPWLLATVVTFSTLVVARPVSGSVAALRIECTPLFGLHLITHSLKLFHLVFPIRQSTFEIRYRRSLLTTILA